MKKNKYFDFKERIIEKQLSREKDKLSLENNIESEEELNNRNGFFSCFNLSNTVIRKRKYKK